MENQHLPSCRDSKSHSSKLIRPKWPPLVFWPRHSLNFWIFHLKNIGQSLQVALYTGNAFEERFLAQNKGVALYARSRYMRGYTVQCCFVNCKAVHTFSVFSAFVMQSTVGTLHVCLRFHNTYTLWNIHNSRVKCDLLPWIDQHYFGLTNHDNYFPQYVKNRQFL